MKKLISLLLSFLMLLQASISFAPVIYAEPTLNYEIKQINNKRMNKVGIFGNFDDSDIAKLTSFIVNDEEYVDETEYPEIIKCKPGEYLYINDNYDVDFKETPKFLNIGSNSYSFIYDGDTYSGTFDVDYNATLDYIDTNIDDQLEDDHDFDNKYILRLSLNNNIDNTNYPPTIMIDNSDEAAFFKCGNSVHSTDFYYQLSAPLLDGEHIAKYNHLGSDQNINFSSDAGYSVKLNSVTLTVDDTNVYNFDEKYINNATSTHYLNVNLDTDDSILISNGTYSSLVIEYTTNIKSGKVGLNDSFENNELGYFVLNFEKYVLTYTRASDIKFDYLSYSPFPELKNMPITSIVLDGINGEIVPNSYNENYSYNEWLKTDQLHLNHDYVLVVGQDDYDYLMNLNVKPQVKIITNNETKYVDINSDLRFDYLKEENNGSKVIHYNFVITNEFPAWVDAIKSGFYGASVKNGQLLYIEKNYDNPNNFVYGFELPYAYWVNNQFDDSYISFALDYDAKNFYSGSYEFRDTFNIVNKSFIYEYDFNGEHYNQEIVVMLTGRSQDELIKYNNLSNLMLVNGDNGFYCQYISETEDEIIFNWYSDVPFLKIGNYDISNCEILFDIANDSSILSYSGKLQDLDINDLSNEEIRFKYPVVLKTIDGNGKKISHYFKFNIPDNPSPEESADTSLIKSIKFKGKYGNLGSLEIDDTFIEYNPDGTLTQCYQWRVSGYNFIEQIYRQSPFYDIIDIEYDDNVATATPNKTQFFDGNFEIFVVDNDGNKQLHRFYYSFHQPTSEEILQTSLIKDIKLNGKSLEFAATNMYVNSKIDEAVEDININWNIALDASYYDELFDNEVIPIEIIYADGTITRNKGMITKDYGWVEAISRSGVVQKNNFTFIRGSLNIPEPFIKYINVNQYYGCDKYTVDENGNYVWEFYYGDTEDDSNFDYNNIELLLQANIETYGYKVSNVIDNIGRSTQVFKKTYVVTDIDGNEQTHIVIAKCNNISAIYNDTEFNGIEYSQNALANTFVANSPLRARYISNENNKIRIDYSITMNVESFYNFHDTITDPFVFNFDNNAQIKIDSNNSISDYDDYRADFVTNSGVFEINVRIESANDIHRDYDIEDLRFDDYTNVVIHRVNGAYLNHDDESLWVFSETDDQDFINALNDGNPLTVSAYLRVKTEYGFEMKWVKLDEPYSFNPNTNEFTCRLRSKYDTSKTLWISIKNIAGELDYIDEVQDRFGEFKTLNLDGKAKTAQDLFDEKKYEALHIGEYYNVNYSLNGNNYKLTTSEEWYDNTSVVFYRVYRGYIISDDYDDARIETIYKEISSDYVLKPTETYCFQYEVNKNAQFFYGQNTSNNINLWNTSCSLTSKVSDNFNTPTLEYFGSNDDKFGGYILNGNNIILFGSYTTGDTVNADLEFIGDQISINEATAINKTVDHIYSITLDNNGQATIIIIGSSGTTPVTYNISLPSNTRYIRLLPYELTSSSNKISYNMYNCRKISYGDLYEYYVSYQPETYNELPKFKLNDLQYIGYCSNVANPSQDSDYTAITADDTDTIMDIKYSIFFNGQWYELNASNFYNYAGYSFRDDVYYKISFQLKSGYKLYEKYNNEYHEVNTTFLDFYFSYKESMDRSNTYVDVSAVKDSTDTNNAYCATATNTLKKNLYFRNNQWSSFTNNANVFFIDDNYSSDSEYKLYVGYNGAKVELSYYVGNEYVPLNIFASGTNTHVNNTGNNYEEIVVTIPNTLLDKVIAVRAYSVDGENDAVSAIVLTAEDGLILNINDNPIIYGSGHVSEYKMPMPYFDLLDKNGISHTLYNNDIYYMRDGKYRLITPEERLWIGVNYQMSYDGHSYDLVYGAQGYKKGIYDVYLSHKTYDGVSFYKKNNDVYEPIEIYLPKESKNKVYVRYANINNINSNSQYLSNNYSAYLKDVTINEQTVQVVDLEEIYKDNISLFTGDQAKAVFFNDTTFSFEQGDANTSESSINKDSTISLLFDELTEDEINELGDNIFHGDGQNTSAPKYLNLVYHDGGDQVVISNNGCVVYWPYPKDIMEDEAFSLKHLENVDRSSNQDSNNNFNGNGTSITSSTPEIYATPEGIIFYLESGNFSPIEFIYTKHIHDLNPVDAVDSTCTQKGHMAYYICDCGAKFLDENGEVEVDDDYLALDLAEHDYYVYVEEKTAATCTENRVDLYKCLHCQATKDVEVKGSKIAHEYEQLSLVKPTCYQTGLLTEKCKHCEQKRYTSIETKEHTFITIPEVAPTFEEFGIAEHLECSECAKQGIKTYGLIEDGVLAYVWSQEDEDLYHYLRINILPQYQITFDGNDADKENAIEPIWLDYEYFDESVKVKYVIPSGRFEKKGYTLVSYKDANNNVYLPDHDYWFYEDTNLVAQWQINSYVVDIDGSKYSVKYGTLVKDLLPKTDPIRDGFEFDGWLVNGEQYVDTMIIEGDCDIKSTWSFTVNDPSQIEGKDLSNCKVINNSNDTIIIETQTGVVLIPANETSFVTYDDNDMNAKLADVSVLKDLTKSLSESETVPVSINLNVGVLDLDTIPQDDKNALLGELQGNSALRSYSNDLIILDISIEKTVNNVAEEYHGQLQSDIAIIISLPDEIVNRSNNVNRIYKVLHVLQDNSVEILDAVFDSTNQTIRISTDTFSTYGITYMDEYKQEEYKTKGYSYKAPKTGV